jgi:hypothetical protein
VIPNGPLGELGLIAEVLEIVNVAEYLILQLGVANLRDGAVLVQSAVVARQAWREISNVHRQLLDHASTHLASPNGLWCIKLTQEDLGKLFRT